MATLQDIVNKLDQLNNATGQVVSAVQALKDGSLNTPQNQAVLDQIGSRIDAATQQLQAAAQP